MKPILDSCQVGQAVRLSVVFMQADLVTPIDVSEWDDLTIRVGYPGQTSADFPATFVTDGTDGAIQADLSGDDLDEAGIYLVQGFADDDGKPRRTERAKLLVNPNVPDQI